MPRGPRVDFSINEDTSSCLVVGPSLTKKGGDFDPKKDMNGAGKSVFWIWANTVCGCGWVGRKYR